VTSALQGQLDLKASTSYVDSAVALRVAKTGDTMTGQLIQNSRTADGIKMYGSIVGTPLMEEQLLMIRPVNPSVQNGTSFGLHLGSLDTGINSKSRIHFNLSGSPGAGNTWGYIPDVSVMTLTGAGNVGIGSTLPTAPLDVVGDITTTGNITTTNTGTSAGVLAKRFYLTARGDNQDSSPADEIYGPWYGLGESGIAGFTGKPCLTGYYGCALRSGLGYMVLTDGGNVGIGTTDPAYKLQVNGAAGIQGTVYVGINGASANVTPALSLSSSASHIDDNAGQVYLFTAYNGHMAIASDTVRNASTTNLVVGVASTGESQVISVNSDNTAYKPMSFASSRYTFVGGGLDVAGDTPYALQAGFMSKGTITIGSTTNNYGGGNNWTTNTAGFLMECLNYTEFAVHDAGERVCSFMHYYGNQFTIGRNMGWGTTPVTMASNLTVNGNGGFYGILNTYANGPGGPSIIYSENAAAGEAYAVFHCRNNTGSGSYWFHNSSTRTGDGGPNTATLRNDIGALRLQSQGGNGFTIDATTGYTRQYGGDTSKILFGPNASWSAYLVVGSGTNEVSATKAQVISTNGNLHLDAGAGRVLYLNYYEAIASNDGCIYSYTPWTHSDTFSLTSHFYRGLNPSTSYSIQDNTENRLMLRDNDGYVRHGQVSTFHYKNNSIAWTGLVTINNLLYKRRNAVVVLNFNCSWYATSVSNVYITVRLNSMTTGKIYQTHQYQQFMNFTANHTSATIPLVFYFDQADDWCQLQAFASGAGVSSDNNDSIWINALVIG
jgi:hypothetical protein